MDVLADEVWNFFGQIDRNKKNEAWNKSNSQWQWIFQSNNVQKNTEVVQSNTNKLVIRIPLKMETFELELHRTEQFPKSCPKMISKYIDGFNYFVWSQKKNLEHLVREFANYCELIDKAIYEIRDCRGDGFEVENIQIDQEENSYLWVILKHENYNECITLSINLENYREFPRILRTSNPKRVHAFNCENWIVDDRLGSNLKRIFSNFEENSIEKCKTEEKENKRIFDDSIDFI